MKLIEKLTPEQEAKIPIYLKKYYDRVYLSKKLDKELCRKSIEYIYINAGYKAPCVWYCHSPLMMQIIANLFTNKELSNLGSNLQQVEYNPYEKAIQKVRD